MDPVTTPYDIAAIPQSPLAPSALAWLVLFGTSLLVALIVFVISRRNRATLCTPRNQVIQQIKSCKSRLSEHNPRQIASEAVIALSRYFETALPDALHHSKIQSSPAYHALDQIRFSPTPDSSSVRVLLEALDKNLTEELAT